jgi:hypothetical protein
MRLFLTCSIFLLASCRIKEKPCTPSPLPVLLRIVSTTGTDLLNPANAGGYDTTKIKMYSNLSATEDKLYVLPNTTADSFFLETIIIQNWENAQQYFIKFPDGDVDTIITTQRLASESCGTYELLLLKYNGIPLIPAKLVSTNYGPVTGYKIIK